MPNGTRGIFGCLVMANLRAARIVSVVTSENKSNDSSFWRREYRVLRVISVNESCGASLASSKRFLKKIYQYEEVNKVFL
jgi:hypothetical protein